VKKRGSSPPKENAMNHQLLRASPPPQSWAYNSNWTVGTDGELSCAHCTNWAADNVKKAPEWIDLTMLKPGVIK